jgi:hypothetical protein
MRLHRPEPVYDPDALDILQQAYDEACRQVGIDPHPIDGGLNKEVREALARAIVDMAAAGLRDPCLLRTKAQHMLISRLAARGQG